MADKKPENQEKTENKGAHANLTPATKANPYNSVNTNSVKTGGSIVASILLVIFYLILTIIGLGALLFAAAFVVCMGM